jgi:hypothetical protein
VRPLSGRGGDLAYLILWTAMLAVPGINAHGAGRSWAPYVDVMGLLFSIDTTGGDQPGRELAIGLMEFDPQKPGLLLPAIHWTLSLVGQRLASALLALPCLLLARVAFARFDPARVKASGAQVRRNPIAQINQRLKFLCRPLLPLLGLGNGFTRLVVAELLLTLLLSPLALLAAAGLGLLGLFAPLGPLRAGLLPAAFVLLAITIAEVSTRDRRAGAGPLLLSLPGVARQALPAKFLAALGVGLLLLWAPLLRLLLSEPAAALSLLLGASFLAAAAVALGELTGSAKAFTGGFALFFYLVLNVRSPELDFAGWNGLASGRVRLGYAAASAGLLLLAAAKRRLAGRGSAAGPLLERAAETRPA